MLLEYRKQIDKIDESLLALLKERMLLSKKVALYKKEQNLSIEQTGREEQILHHLKEQASNELSPAMIEEIWQNIFKFSKKVQSIAINDE